MDGEWLVRHHADTDSDTYADADADTYADADADADTHPDTGLFIPDLERRSELQPGHRGEIPS
jgi:hypothetical protein